MMSSNKYDDILHLPHPVSDSHPPMPMAERAAQFSPFAALTGYDAAICEAGRLTDVQIELDENEKTLLNEKLLLILERIGEHPELSITYFQPDERKTGGAYLCVTGNVKKIDTYTHSLLLSDGQNIPFELIYRIESDFFGILDA